MEVLRCTMLKIHGTTVELVNRIATGERDRTNRPIIVDSEPIPVEDVLVGEPSSDDITNSLNLYGKRVKYTLGIPKGDTHTWEGDVIIWGKRYHIFTAPTKGIDANVPTRWNTKVMVEEFENGK